jgi:hypothetical protein
MFIAVMKNKAAMLPSSPSSHNRLAIKLYKCCNKIIVRDKAIVAISCAMLFGF